MRATPARFKSIVTLPVIGSTVLLAVSYHKLSCAWRCETIGTDLLQLDLLYTNLKVSMHVLIQFAELDKTIDRQWAFQSHQLNITFSKKVAYDTSE